MLRWVLQVYMIICSCSLGLQLLENLELIKAEITNVKV